MSCIDHGLKGNKQGYAFSGGMNLHRKVCLEANGLTLETARGLVVRHTCDNTRCINPDHLVLGTHAQNSADMVERKRQATGERVGSAKLTAEQVQWIRANYVKNSREFGSPALGRKFGVNGSCIRKIISGEKWNHA